ADLGHAAGAGSRIRHPVRRASVADRAAEGREGLGTVEGGEDAALPPAQILIRFRTACGLL
ncbi:MAG: hypothetical protein IJI45_05315, partial [Anaerolineaceae bacterium]|nr:hypothetical protein [Anaerolineaceae bacterium]